MSAPFTSDGSALGLANHGSGNVNGKVGTKPEPSPSILWLIFYGALAVLAAIFFGFKGVRI